MSTFLSDLKYIWYVIFHPFDGFYEVRFRRKKNYMLAALILLLYSLLGIIKYQYTGFIINNNPIHEMNSLTRFLFTLFPFLLFAISNWSVTAIFEGSGKFGDIVNVLGYSLLPKLIIDALGIVISNFIILEEVPILNVFLAIGNVWFCYLIFAGLCVIHEYNASTNIVMIITTFIAAIIIVFLSTLYLSLMERVVNFFVAFISELVKRL
ncbi:MAG: DUF1282 family protein [Clostridiaceae bacterium]|nr:DUF1282 family protein [Clostridiaceae bacterium]